MECGGIDSLWMILQSWCNMGAFAGDLDAILYIPPTSPSRRDYQLRSVSPQSSRQQSPWMPAERASSPEVNTFRLNESHPPARSNYYSGPLPSAPQGVDRSFYSGPLPTLTPSPPSFSGPLPGFSTTVSESFGFAAWAKIYHQQHVSENHSVPGSLDGSSQEGASERERYGDDAGSEVDELRPYYLSNPGESRVPETAEFAERAGKYGVARNFLSGELGIREEIAKQKSEVARGYKSGEILGLNICADGIYNSSPPVANVVEVHSSQQTVSSAWDALMKDAKSENFNCDSEVVAIPFTWDEVPGKAKNSVSTKPNSRASSISTQKMQGGSTGAKSLKSDFSFGSSHKFNGGVVKASEKAESVKESEVRASDVVAPALKPVKTLTPPPKATSKKEIRSAVPFRWEEAPGKPKLEDKATRKEVATPLQLPPRLASASIKRNARTTTTPASRSRSSSTSSVSKTRATKPTSKSTNPTSKSTNPTKPTKQSRSGSVSTSSAVGKHSRQSQELESHSSRQSSCQPSAQQSPAQDENSRHSLSTTFLSGPLNNAAKSSEPGKGVSKSGPMSQFGLPQYQSAEFFCETSETWNRLNSSRSPTSTLHGPGSDGHSIPSSCSNSRKAPSVTYSHSQSGTSAESLEHWSDADHGSKHSFESHSPSHTGSVDDAETAVGTLGKLRMRSHSKPAMAKPPMSPITPSPSAPSPSRYSSSHEEFFDSSAMPSSTLDDASPCGPPEEPPTKLPYKMPSPSDDDVVKPEGPSPTRALRQSSRCFEFPRFLPKSPSQSRPGKLESSSPSSVLEDGYRSPAYKATLDLLSPSPSTQRSSKKKHSRCAQLASPSSSRRPHLNFIVRLFTVTSILNHMSCHL